MPDSVLNVRPGNNINAEAVKSEYSAGPSPLNSTREANGAGSKDVEDYGEKPDTIDASSKESFDLENRSREEQLENGVAATKVSTRISVNNVSAIPNGGVKAWVQVLGSFFLFFNTW